MNQPVFSWHVFCRVVDNFGDIGVCWRLAKQLSSQYQQRVHLWVDDLQSFQALCPEVDPLAAVQSVQDITIYHWQEPLPTQGQQALAQAQIVIEAFACELPDIAISLMQQQQPQACWLNLEYLSAEQWAQDCHLLPSPLHGLQKHFFFPGFSHQTGGLLWENELLELPKTLQTQAAREQLFLELGIAPELAACELQASLFAYENSQVEGLLNSLNHQQQRVHLLVPQGRIQQQVQQWQTQHSMGALTISIIPFMPQPAYDRLLASCQLNFVRGEESFVRAQMLGLPMIWHIYQQEDDAHLIKLEAFLDHYLAPAPTKLAEQLKLAFMHWNQPDHIELSWDALLQQLPTWQQHAKAWQQQQIQHGNLAQNLVQFVQTRYSAEHF